MIEDADERGGGPKVRLGPAPPRTLGLMARLVATAVARATRGERPRVLTTLARHRRLFRWWLPFAGSLLLRSELPRADVELVVLRTACNCLSWYEWAQHVPLAGRAGLSPAAIGAVPSWADHDIWAGRQRALLAATDELHWRRTITDATWASLTAELRERELIELCMLVGHYEMLAMALNSLGVEAEPGALAALDAPAAHTAARLRAALASSQRR
ncbi:MAG TPA: carboxymuconolactone decarboxylase family protein [Actinomycetes bacterium]|nr:carboxymuconolactone decarboxylase family protein [Actinomycetes bacterium]